ncbi:glmZ(sRNA)-inactivating NTPase [Steroidobacter denitrificans]|uniref:GlmZ(SRNA)-inactivating NTPase n=1 Tax=Steroidobacter denitrificans TaxID=465721 RepID=A0A127F908_STEDE|nr:RNase adapter RapZ [Steroidobacter denitrificans]AMN46121.1 glmZ(sRNA)-inactivating NTPase [Steroidobacter denitrificans]
MRLVIVSGLSGSGKSVALHMLEDLDYYCIDNIPAGLLPMFISHTVRSQESTYSCTAVGVDARNRPAEIASVPKLIEELKHSGLNCEVLFLRADQDALLKRYSETRRRHPLSRSGLGLADALEQERVLLEPIADAADLIIDTTRTSVHDLRELIRQRVAGRIEGRMSILFVSFAFRHGVPADADFVFDVRSLPNPYWEPGLAPLTGRDSAVVEYLEHHPIVARMFADVVGFLEHWIPELIRTNRSYLTIAIGCTGGQHRSVYLVERLARHFSSRYAHVNARHQVLGAPGPGH